MRLASLVLVAAFTALSSGVSGAGASARATSSAAGTQDANPVPEAPTGLTAATRQGHTLTLTWAAPVSGPAPDSYVIEAGYGPGEVIGSLALGPVPAITLDAPDGVFYVRVHAVAGASRSAASNELRLVVGEVAPPSAPVHLLGLVNGSALHLSWSNTHDGGATTQLWLRVNGANVLPLPLGESFTYDGVPDGTYDVSVVAANAAGSSAPSNSVALRFPSACSGPPAAPVSFSAWSAGATLHLSWAPPSSGPAVTSYTVVVSGTFGGSLETTGRALSGPLPPGDYAVRIIANNACGQSAAAPAGPDWTAVARQNGAHVVHFATTPAAEGYRIYWSTERTALEQLDGSVPFIETAASPVTLPVADDTAPLYYRVFERHGPVAGAGGPVAAVPQFDVMTYPDWPGNLTPGLWDIDGDGCLDMVGAKGLCDGTFATYPLASAGLDGLIAGNRVITNRDSRLADFTGDGITDIFTNVYDRADSQEATAVLHVGDGRGGYTEDPDVTALQIRGHGETVLAADFDNDGDLDIFIPHYTHLDDGGHNWLLVNDGAGHFADLSAAAGLARNLYFQPEGAQAIDVNQDGWIDIHVASSLWINNGDLTFTDRSTELGLPALFDEGLRLVDVDLDGDFDLVHHDASVTRLYENQDGHYAGTGAYLQGDPDGSTFGYGLNVCDVNGDGYEDLIVAHNDRTSGTGQPRLLLNAGGQFLPTALPDPGAAYNDLLSCGDLDNSGLPDIVARSVRDGDPDDARVPPVVGHHHYLNRSGATAAVRLRVVGVNGERNQQGRIVRVRPLTGPPRVMMRPVESGSGLLAQNGYDLLVATPWDGDYEVAVRFASGWVRTTAKAGDALTIRADGTVLSGLR